MLPTINAVWIGREMGVVSAACLKSFLNTDHTVALYSYGEVADAPKGVEYRDANLLLPEERLLRYANGGSYSISSNLIRYEILKRGLGLYVDCDVYCLRPMEDVDTIFGRESSADFNTAVLKLPVDSPVLVDLCSIKEGWVPPWLAGKPPSSLPKPLNEYPWGTTGPRALTHFAKKHRVGAMAAPFDVFYPVPFDRWSMFDDPGLRLRDLVTPRTHYVHLWSEMRRRAEVGEPAPNSPLEEMVSRTWQSPLRRAAKAVYRKIRPS